MPGQACDRPQLRWLKCGPFLFSSRSLVSHRHRVWARSPQAVSIRIRRPSSRQLVFLPLQYRRRPRQSIRRGAGIPIRRLGLRVAKNLSDFAQLVKMYSSTGEPDTRYSPAECTGCRKIVIYGDPDMKIVSTSHVERHNLSTRMQSRRYTRLTNAFSKKWANRQAALALWYAYYNFCRVHSSLRVTPAMEAGLTNHIWTLKELLSA